MRFKISFQLTDPTRNMLPVNYQYELSSWIYKTLSYGSPEFSEFLHVSGYLNKDKKFKLFCFSRLQTAKYRVAGDRMTIQGNEISLIISFLPVEALEPFVCGIFKGLQFNLGDKKSQVPLRVSTVERLADPEFSNSMSFHLLSPIHMIKPRADNPAQVDHLSPEHPDYERLLLLNLTEKYNAYNTPKVFYLTGAKFELLSKIQTNVITIKTGTPQETRLKGFLFDFRLIAPAALLKTGYYAGFGKENSQGFGCGEILK